MNTSAFSDYQKDRYENQIEWYSKKSSLNKKYYTIFQWSVIVISASVPVLIALPFQIEWLTVPLSIILAIGTTGLKTFKFQENWINYRNISEALKKEKHYYAASLGAYKGVEDKEAVFIDRVEAMISSENNLWTTTHMQKAEEKEKE